MPARFPLRRAALLPVVVFVVASGVKAALALGPQRLGAGWELVLTVALLGFPVTTGALLSHRVPGRPVGPALSWLGAAPAAVFALEAWGDSVGTPHPLPGAYAVHVVKLGAWVWNPAGFAALCLVFPDGLLPGRRWRAVAWLAVIAAVAVNVVASLSVDSGRRVPVALTLATFAGLLAALAATVVGLVVRYRRGDEVLRLQLRWLVLGASTVPVLLAAGWVAQSFGASPAVAYAGFLVAMLIAVPVAVAVAVLRYDLFDVDRLLGSSLAWLLTSLVSAGLFAAVVYVVSADNRLGVTGAAFVTALTLLPLHRLVNDTVGRAVDRERFVVRARIDDFVRRVRDGRAEPEQVEAVLRAVLRDPALRLLIRLPGSAADSYVDLNGDDVGVPAGATRVPLVSNGSEVGALHLGSTSARRSRRAGEAARRARLPIEVSRLRLQLRAALRDARSSRSRLLHATVEERRRLERDLHDGAQQQIVAVGMRLRSVQRRLDPAAAPYAELDEAVEALAATVADLRRLAHGVRPGRLDDGLPAALRALVADSPIPVRLTVEVDDVSEVLTTTVYFVAAETYANALKHSRATNVTIDVHTHDGVLRVAIRDDGIGGARLGFGLTSVRDRVASVGGTLYVHSPAGGPTAVEAAIEGNG